jgi:CBS domain-containing protein
MSSSTGAPRRAEVTVGELMSSPVTAVVPQIDVLTALRLMRRMSVHHLPVVADSECGGLVTATDLLLALATPPHGALATVGGVCRRPAPRVECTATRSTAARLMVREETDALVVVLGTEVVGMLTAVDLVRSLIWLPVPTEARSPT